MQYFVHIMLYRRYRKSGTIPSTVIYGNGNSGRSLLDRKRSEEHPQSSNESIKTKTRQKKRQKERETDGKKTKKQIMPERIYLYSNTAHTRVLILILILGRVQQRRDAEGAH